MAATALSFDEGVPDWAIDLLVEGIVAATATKIPRPIIKAAVRGALRWVSDVDLSIIRDILERLAIPTTFAREIWKQFQDDAEEVACELTCPASGDTICLEAGDGEYTCPDCGADIVVEDGEAAYDDVAEVRCPSSGDTIQLRQGDGDYACPDCSEDIAVEDGVATHVRTALRRGARVRRTRKT